MKIEKYFNLIKLSDFNDIDGGYLTITVTGNINCCQENCTDLVSEEILDINEGGLRWIADIDKIVNLQGNIVALYVQSVFTQSPINVLTTPVPLIDILGNCADTSCTLQTDGSTALTDLKTQIDAWFLANLSITTDVQVSAISNRLIIEELPDNYIMTGVQYDEDDEDTIIPFGFTGEDIHVFLNNTGETIIYVAPEFFNDATEFIDGIYKFTVKFNYEEGSYVQEENCAFIDITLKCRVAGTLQNILKESKISGEQPSTLIHLWHYALVNGSNCHCNCDELCDLFKELVTILDTLDLNINADCAC